jgi:hypothetical protein
MANHKSPVKAKSPAARKPRRKGPTKYKLSPEARKKLVAANRERWDVATTAMNEAIAPYKNGFCESVWKQYESDEEITLTDIVNLVATSCQVIETVQANQNLAPDDRSLALLTLRWEMEAVLFGEHARKL